ncbi:MAG: hypothetical protein QMC40_01170 [Vicingaceae bacterium]
MGLAASAVSLYTGFVGFLVFSQSFPDLPDYSVWSIRMSIFIFVVFSFQGFLMGSKMNHSAGALNDNSNWFIPGWSKTVGDLRVLHFIGMHALLVLPFVSFYLFKNTPATLVFSVFYGLLTTATLIQALKGRPVFKTKKNKVVSRRNSYYSG